MNEAVVDASVVLKWFRTEGERHVGPARALRAAYEAGGLIVFAPPLLHLEIVNVAGRRWQWAETELVGLAAALDDLGFELIDPDLDRVAVWTARGLTAYDAAYVAVAQACEVPLVTDDDLVVATAIGIAKALSDAEA